MSLPRRCVLREAAGGRVALEDRLFVHIRDEDGHVNDIIDVERVHRPYRHGIRCLRLIVVADAGLGLDLSALGVDVERRRVPTFQAVG